MTESYKSITSVPAWLETLKSDGVPDSNATLYGAVPYLYRLVQLRCDALTGVPVKLWRIDDKDRTEEQEWPFPTALSHLLWRWEASLLLSGACYGEIIRNKTGYQKDVAYRNPFDMTVDYKTGIITIKQSQSGAVWHNDIYRGIYEMFYLAEYDAWQDILPGVSAGKAGNMDAKLLYALAKFPEMYFEGGAMPVTLLGIDTTDRNEIQRIETWFQKSATAIKNAFRVLGIRAGSIQPTTLTPLLKDLALPELNEEAKNNLAVAFGVPKSMLDTEAANYATAQESRLSFYEDTIKPRAKRIADALNEQLLAREGLLLEFAFNEMDIFQEDENDRADLFIKLAAHLPVELALDMAGYELSEDQLDKLIIAQAAQAENRPDDMELDLQRWQRMVEKRIKEGKGVREFESAFIPASLKGAIEGALETVKTVEGVREVFLNAIAWRGYP